MKLRKRIKAALRILPAGYHTPEQVALAAGASQQEADEIPGILRALRGRMVGAALIGTACHEPKMWVTIHRSPSPPQPQPKTQ